MKAWDHLEKNKDKNTAEQREIVYTAEEFATNIRMADEIILIHKKQAESAITNREPQTTVQFYIKKLDEWHQAIRKWGEEQRKHFYYLK